MKVFTPLFVLLIATLLLVASKIQAGTNCDPAWNMTICNANLFCSYGNFGCALKSCGRRTLDNCTNTKDYTDDCFVSGTSCINCNVSATSPAATTCATGCSRNFNSDTFACGRTCGAYSLYQCTATTDRKQRCQLATGTAGSTSNSATCVDIPQCTGAASPAECTNRTGGCAWNYLTKSCGGICAHYYNELGCSTYGCVWNASASYNKCTPKPISSCSGAGNYEQCSSGSMGCTWDATKNTCRDSTCAERKGAMCLTQTAKAMNCFQFGANAMCASCTTDNSTICTSTEACMWSNSQCVHSCQTLTSTECSARASDCQAYTAPRTAVSTTITCVKRPQCGSVADTATCSNTVGCFWDKVNAVCKVICTSWKNSIDCSADTGCEWNSTSVMCQVAHASSTAAPTQITNAPTTAAPTKITEATLASTTAAPKPQSCFDLNLDQCRSAEAQKAGCWIYTVVGAASYCVTCNSGTTSSATSGSTNTMCNTTFCSKSMNSDGTSVCIPQCRTYNSSACPAPRCQKYTPAIFERTTLQCVEVPNCKLMYSAESSCAADSKCEWNLAQASCDLACSSWKNPDNCLSRAKCNWNNGTAVCEVATTTAAPTKGTNILTTAAPTKGSDVLTTAAPTKGTDVQTTAAPTKITEGTVGTTAAPTNAPTSCVDILDARTCIAYSEKLACNWNLRAAACVFKPCVNRTSSTCLIGDAATRGCFAIKERYCASCSGDACDALACSVSADGTCQRKCFTFSDEKSCAVASSGCSWNSTYGVCLNYVAPAPIKPLPSYIPCPDRDSSSCVVSSAVTIASTSDCVWDSVQGKCKYPACNTYTADKCPDTRCRIAAVVDTTNTAGYVKKCAEKCPEDYPVFCDTTNVCAESLDKCVACSSNQVQCWNSKCAGSLLECDCPPNRQIRCDGTKTCVSTQDQCAAQNTCDGQLCWDGSCITSTSSVDPATGLTTKNRCPCPSATPHRCDDGTCAADDSSCVKRCAEPTSFKCWNGECATNLAGCACSADAPFRCQTDNTCAVDQSRCICPTGTEKCAGTTTCVATGSCQIVCPTAQPIRCDFGTGTAACSATVDGCPCPDSAWQSAVVVASIQAMASSTVEVSAAEKHRVSATAIAYVCRSKREMTARFVWRLVDLTMKQVVSLPATAVVGSVLAVDTSSILVAGHEYQLSVVATLVRTGIDLASAPSATASITFTATKKAAQAVILGGATRRLSTQDSSLTVSVDPTKLGGDLSSAGNYVNLPSVKWSCACAENTCTACPDALTRALSAASTAQVSVDTSSSKIPAGQYTITAKVCSSSSTSSSSTDANTCDGPVATQTITVDATVTPKAQVGIYGVPSQEALLSNIATVTLYARTSVASATLSWSVNDVKRTETGNSITFAAGTLQAGNTYKIQVVASTDGSSASASTSFTVPTKISGTCKIAIAASTSSTSSTTTSITALATPIKISSSWMGVDSSQLRYRFGYYLNRGQVWLSPSAGQLSSFEAIAPMVTGDAAREVTFIVGARLANSDKDVAVATCTVTVTPPSSTDANTKLQNAGQVIKDCKASNDTSRLANVVATLSGAVATFNADPAKKNDAQSLAVQAVSTLANATAGRDLSRTERSTIIQGLRSTIGGEESTAPSTNTNTDSSSNNNKFKGQTTTMNSTAQDLAIRALLRAVDAPSQGAGSQDSMDSQNDARDALGVLNNMTIKRPEITQAAIAIARNVAAQSDLGKTQVHQFTNISVAGVSLPGSATGRLMLNASNSSIAFPAGFAQFSDESNKYSISATEFKQNPVSTTGTPDKKKIGSVVVDFVVQNNGQQQPVTNSNQPIEIQIKLSPELREQLIKLKQQAASAASSSNNASNVVKAAAAAECRYYDETTKSWSTTGVTSGDLDVDQGTMKCSTVHLSTYTVFVNADVTADSTSPTTTVDPNSNGAAPTTSSASGLTSGQRTGLIAGVIGGIALVVVIALFVRARRNSATTGYSSGGAYADETTNMNHLLFAAPQVEFDETELRQHQHPGRNNNNNNEFANL